ncbi:MAG: hypothetical protein R3Y63_04610 [Eubacteriales bacterium]
MNISSNLTGGLSYQPKATPTPENTSDFSFSLEVEKQESIFSGLQPGSSYTVHNTGEFPDFSFFQEKFPELDFVENRGDVAYIANEDGTILGISHNGYDFLFEYAENSTPENPIMNVRFEHWETKEAWEGTINLKGIDPSSASMMESVLLAQHLTGSPESFLQRLGSGSLFSKENYVDSLQAVIDEVRERWKATGSLDLLEKLEEDLFALESFWNEDDDIPQEEYREAMWAQDRFTRELMAQVSTDSSGSLRSALMGNA